MPEPLVFEATTDLDAQPQWVWGVLLDDTLRAAGAGTAFRMREVSSGPLPGMIGTSIPDPGPSFTRFVSGLKTEVERRG